jgi:hypothetical protein
VRVSHGRLPHSDSLSQIDEVCVIGPLLKINQVILITEEQVVDIIDGSAGFV